MLDFVEQFLKCWNKKKAFHIFQQKIFKKITKILI